MFTMLHSNPAQLQNGVLLIDRKFHLGMLNYVAKLGERIVTVHPKGEMPVMDPVELAVDKLGYQVLVHDPDLSEQIATLDYCVRNSSLIYGEGLGVERIARELGIPQVAVLEYDLATQISVAASQVSSRARKLSRSLKTAWHYRQANKRWGRVTALHCNGYPIYDAMSSCNQQRLLYLDSRMDADMLIEVDTLERRLSNVPNRLRLLYSGRYEPMKGAIDCIKVAIACIELNIDVELHCYGQGSQHDAMVGLVEATRCGDRVMIHDAVPYPELVKISRGFDAFVCCHVQADPSCTYLESFGAGLPIVGYGNTMWRRLCEESGAGFYSQVHQPGRVAKDVARLAADHGLLAEKSRLARTFAAAHTFEIEFRKRTDDMLRLARPEAPLRAI